jgi:hypothetical protein
VEDCWWLSGMGREVIAEICDLLSNEDPEIQLLLKWPQQLAGVETTLISPQDAFIDPMLIQ